MSYRVGIVGATGAVGQELIDLLHRRNFPMSELVLLASSRSAGKTITWQDKTWTVQEATPESFDTLDIAIFSASGSLSTELCPEAAKRDCLAIDNSSAFRMDPKVPLVVPEINPEAARGHQGIIANPNCSTAVALMGLYPLHREFGLKRFFAATYQAVSGAGAAAMAELEDQLRAWSKGEPMTVSEFPHQIAFNLIPHVDVFYDDGYTKEEHKMINESRKIMGMPDLKASTTCVRVPVLRAHSMAINAEFEQPVDVERAQKIVAAFEGAELVDAPAEKQYPMPIDFSGKEKCGVGRIRRDSAFDNGLALWVVGDQLWKGAALNAVQIAELVVADNIVTPKVSV
ncbi:aspartate-semialdehyde dehydrogenase [Cerasicoccus frondis]|uniref:aspartate-semialdehyde dehydrogenase n=1 Tax=Cerasicoccus frondis TaxID=490090 RepID=UPI0028526031|nr:aspartate-semialdehyde dehydrogenase [Cerasicoccus frondis]